MGRGYRALLSLLAGLVCGGPGLCAAPPPTPASTPSAQVTPPPGTKPVYLPPLSPPVPAGPELPPRGRFRNTLMEGRVPGEGGGTVAERLARMSPEEREAFKRNLHLWQQLPPEQRQAMHQLINERNREEISNALRESGMQLSDDQRELFALRYLQERRKLEREIQEQANAERARRLPEILRQLKSEFAPEKARTTPGASPVGGASPASR